MFWAFAATAQTPAFPGAYGFGQFATGGRNGSTYHVTTLADSGAGSFRDAVSQANRCIVFDIGGTIALQSKLGCSDNLTIEGQTAPGGIALIGHEVSFSLRTNEIVRYLRIRPGDVAASTEDGINMGDGTNMIFDHISIEFAPYNSIDAHGGNTDGNRISFQNSILADPISQRFNAHTEAVNNTFSWCYNIFASGHDRNPMAKVNTIFVNNVIYNFQAGYTVAGTGGIFSHDIVNNYFITGPSTTSPSDDFFQMDNNQSIYAAGNILDSDHNGVLGGSATAPGGVTVLNSPWSPLTTAIPTYPTANAYRYDVSVSGALPRDAVDQLVLADVTSLGTSGQLWNSQSSTGLNNNGYGTLYSAPTPINASGDGLADYWKLANGLGTNLFYPLTNTPDGYTLQEHYFNWLATPDAVTLTNTSVAIDLWQFTAGFTNASPIYSLGNASSGSVTLQNGHVASFTPTADFIGLASFPFAVSISDGSSYSNTVTVCVTPQILLSTNNVTLPPPPVTEQAPAIFVCFSSSTSGSATVTISPPAGGSYSAADPVDVGTIWNNLRFVTPSAGSASPGNPTNNPTTNTLWASPMSLVNSLGSNTASTLTITNYYNTAGGHGEYAAITQTGGAPKTLFENAWRIYFGTDYSTYTISGLTPGGLYDLYFYGSGTDIGRGTSNTLSTANQLGANARSAGTSGETNATVFNGTQVSNQGVTWNLLHGQADASGNFTFTQSEYTGGLDYMNGFQLQPLIPPAITGLSNQTVYAGGMMNWTAAVTGVPTPSLQWQTNGVNLADTTNSLTLSAVQFAQAGGYSLIATNTAGAGTNTVFLTVLPIIGPAFGAVSWNDGSLQLSFSGVEGSGYRLWGSTNLASGTATNNWTLLSSGTFGADPASFTDSQAANYPQRFYSITTP